jgi:hypothetical protein
MYVQIVTAEFAVDLDNGLRWVKRTVLFCDNYLSYSS